MEELLEEEARGMVWEVGEEMLDDRRRRWVENELLRPRKEERMGGVQRRRVLDEAPESWQG